MSEIHNIMVALQQDLADLYPTRKVERDLLDFADRPEADLVAGIYTLIAGPESDFPNYRGREGNFGTLDVIIVGQIKVAENTKPSATEDAESAMIDEIKAFTRSGPAAPIDSVVLKSYRRSQQLEHPYGWVACAIEVQTQ